MRASFESVWRNGVDLTDTVDPHEWPEPYRSDFFDLGWRPFIPAGVTPVWLDHAAGATEPTASPLERRRAAARSAG